MVHFIFSLHGFRASRKMGHYESRISNFVTTRLLSPIEEGFLPRRALPRRQVERNGGTNGSLIVPHVCCPRSRPRPMPHAAILRVLQH